MKRSFPVLTLAGTLLVGASALPALAQSQADIVNDPQSVSYSWGVLHSPADGPQVAYTRSELNQTPRTAAQVSAQSRGAGGEAIENLAPYEEFIGPSYTRYSWGVLKGSSDSRGTALTWDDLRRRLNATTAPAPVSAQSKGAPAEFVTDFDHIAYSWGVIHSPVDGPQVAVPNGQRVSASAGAAADPQKENPQEAYTRNRPDPRD